MKIIFGSGGAAKELIAYMEHDRVIKSGNALIISTEDFNNRMYTERYHILRFVPDEERFQKAEWHVAIADPTARMNVVSGFPFNAHNWRNFIASDAHVSPYATLGAGIIMAPQVIIAGDPVIGDFVFMNTNATVGHDTRIGSFCTLMPNTEICGDCNIGHGCFFGIGATVLPGVTIPPQVKVSAGTIVRKSVSSELAGATIYPADNARGWIEKGERK